MSFYLYLREGNEKLKQKQKTKNIMQKVRYLWYNNIIRFKGKNKQGFNFLNCTTLVKVINTKSI